MKKQNQTALDDGSTPESDAVILVYLLSKILEAELEGFCTNWGVTTRQFNVLRILYVRDPDRQGMSRGAIVSRLVQRGPDVTRMLDRLQAADLIARHRPKDNQRTVLATLTDKGWDLIENSHQSLLALNRAQIPNFNEGELKQFIALLKKAFDRPVLNVATK